MSKIDVYVIMILLLQISFTIINTTGIFPVAEDVTGFDQDGIIEKVEILDKKVDKMESALDYFSILGTILVLGVEIIINLVTSLFGAVPSILKLFFMPDVIANAIGYAVDVLVLLGLGNMFLRRS